MPEEFSDILTELKILRKAAHLLMDINQLTAAAASLIADQTRNVLTTGARYDGPSPCTVPGYDMVLFPRTPTPDPLPTPGFTLADRVAQLGYRLTFEEYHTCMPRLADRVQREWATREGSPARAEGQAEDWYLESDGAWVDPIIQSYLAQFPDVKRTQPVDEE